MTDDPRHKPSITHSERSGREALMKLASAAAASRAASPPLLMEETAEEQRLLTAAQAGDRAAFDGLVRMHFGAIYARLFRLTGNHEDAEDLAQDCFVRAYRSLSYFRAEGSFRGWLTRIAVHRALDFLRSHGRRTVNELERALDVAVPAWRGPEQEAGRGELSQRLNIAIDSLPKPLKVALSLRVLEGLEYDEVARITGLRPGTVRTQVMKARRLLVRLLGPLVERKRP